MNIRYVIPSYNRVNLIGTHTLNFLERNNIDKSKIYIFVVPEEYNLYKEKYPEYTIVEGKVGLRNQRNFISEYFSEGEFIISLDDDIKDIMFLDEYNNFVMVNNFQEVVLKGFSDCLRLGASLFGFYPVLNKDWMGNQDDITTCFRFIIGSCFGYINRQLKITVNQKDDYEISILNYIRDKKVLRYNNYSIKTKYYKQSGGLQSFNNRLQEQQEAVNYLVNTYPEYLAIKKGRKSGFPELRVKRIA